MKQKTNVFKFLLLILTLLLITPCLGGDSPKRIRGVIAGYDYGSFLLVRTAVNQYVFIGINNTTPMNPLPESILQKPQIWDFAVKPVPDCNISFSFLRFQDIRVRCGNEYPREEPKSEPSPILNPYPQIRYINQIYRKELDAISDETPLPCYEIDLNNTKPRFRERVLDIIVIGHDNVPIANSNVSVGFGNEKRGYIYVPTNGHGKFSIPVFENFSYWVKPGGLMFIEGEKQYKATFIVKKNQVEPLTVKLKHEQ